MEDPFLGSIWRSFNYLNIATFFSIRCVIPDKIIYPSKLDIKSLNISDTSQVHEIQTAM